MMKKKKTIKTITINANNNYNYMINDKRKKR